MQEMMGEKVTFFWGHLNPVENYVTLAWGERMLGGQLTVSDTVTPWNVGVTPLGWAAPHCAAASFELTFKGNQFFYKDLTMHDPKLAGDGKLNKAQSFPHIVHSLRMVTQRLSQELKQMMLRDILYGRHSPQSLQVLQSHRIICWVNSVFSLPQGVMFFILSLPLGIKRWSHGDLSSCLLHQVVVKGPFPSGRKHMSLELWGFCLWF